MVVLGGGAISYERGTPVLGQSGFLAAEMVSSAQDLQDHHVVLRDVQWFRGGLVFKAHRLLYHSTLGLRVIKKRREG